MTGTEIYKRTPTYEREAETIRLHAPQWKLLLAFDGQRSLAEVALSIEMAFSDALPLTETFLGHGWIEEQPITLSQYLKRTGAVEGAAGSAVTPAVVLHGAKSEAHTPAPQLASAVMEEAVPTFKGTPPGASPVTPSPTPTSVAPSTAAAPESPAPEKTGGLASFFGGRTPPPLAPPPLNPAKVPPLRTLPSALHPPPGASSTPPTPPPVMNPLATSVLAATIPPPVVNAPPAIGPPPVSAPSSTTTPAPASSAAKVGMKIKSVVDYIVSQVGNNSLGQLVVYRVFLRVPPQLLQAEDIASVHLVNDQSVVKTDELKQAIAGSVMEVLKRSLPESIMAS